MILDIVIIVFKYQAGYMQTKLKENEIILNFFGIKLKFKSSINSNFISLNDLKDSWRYNGTNKELISIFKILYNYKSRKKLDDESILIYICSLYELNQNDLAKNIASKSIRKISSWKNS